jgi:cell division protein FtsW (lipid II flippase)
MLLLAQVAPETLLRWAHWIFGIGLAMLIAVLVLGEVGKGAQRWLSLGAFRFQPSELMKLAVPMMVAWYFAEKPIPPRFTDIAIALAIVLVPTLLIAKQPDLGTALLIASSGLFVLLFAGLSWRLISIASVLSIPLAWAVWEWYMLDYQRQRVLTFLNPENDPLGRPLRQGLAQRHPVTSGIYPRAPHRLHLRRAQRGVRPDGGDLPARHLPLHRHARSLYRQPGPGYLRPTARRGTHHDLYGLCFR